MREIIVHSCVSYILFTFYLTPILHLIYSLSISSYDASLQAHDHSLRKLFANIAQEHVYCKERPSITNPFTSLNYFIVPFTNIISMPVLTIPVHDFPFSNLADDCLIDELNPEINAVNEININNPPDFIIDPDHIDYSVLGSIDPDTNFLLGNKRQPSLPLPLFVITSQSLNSINASQQMINSHYLILILEAFQKILKKCNIFWMGYIISLPS